MEKGDSQNYNTERVITVLQYGTKFDKKKVLQELTIFFTNCDTQDLEFIFGKLLNPVAITFQDQAEMSREGAINVCIEAISKLKPNVNFLSSLIPATHNRLCSDNIVESSEEIRLLYLELTCLLIEKHGDLVVPFIEELVEILCVGVADSAPKVKKKSCSTIIQLTEISQLKYQSHLNKLVQPLSEAIKHQHWRVRVAVIQALEKVIINGDPKILPDALAPLTNRFFDDTSHVRMALTKLIGNWMLHHYDRYSYYSQMLPMILTSLSDNDENIRIEGHRLWNAVGIQYTQENEKDLKDKMDWIDEHLEHYPKGVTRPCLGCRSLVEREVGKFALAIGKELGDWVVNVRIKSAQLLSQVVLHAESSITQDLHKIIVPMAKAARDEESSAVVHYVMLAAKYLGYFIPPKTYCPLIFEYIHDANYGELRIVSSIVEGSKPDELQPYLETLAHLLDHSTFKHEEQLERLNLIKSIFTICGAGCFDIGEVVFRALLSVAGLAASEVITKKANELLAEFNNLGGGDKREVFNKYCQPTLTSLLEPHWTVNCHEQFIFTALVSYTGEIIEENVETVLEIFRKCLCKEETDPECILKIIIALNKIITEEEITLPTLEVREKFKDTILKEVILEQLKWKAGRSAEAVRTMATTTLFILLPRQLPEHLLPVVISLIEDASVKTRQLSIASLTRCAPLSELHDSQMFPKVVTAILKRLDDCDQKVREMTVDCIVALYKEELNLTERDYINSSLLEFVYTTILIHLDDQDPKFQNTVIDGLKRICVLEPELLLRKIRVDKFRDREIASQLVTFIENELKNKTS